MQGNNNKFSIILLKYVVVLISWIFVGAAVADEGDWRRYYEDGVELYKAKDYAKAEGVLQRALGIAESEFARSDKHVKSLLYMGLTQYKLGRNTPALQTLEKALKFAKKGLGDSHVDTLEVLEAIASIRLDNGQPQYAEGLFRTLLTERMKTYGENDERVNTAREKLARVLAQIEKYDESAELFAKTLSIAKKGNASQASLAGIMEEYVKVLRKLGNNEKAERIANQAMEMRASEQARESLDTVASEKDNSTGPIALTNSKPAGEYKEPEGFVNFKSKLINTKNYNFSESYMHKLCKDSKIFKSVEHCIVYWFGSNQTLRGKPEPQATLRIVRYEDPSMALLARNNLRTTASADKGINEEWNYIVAQGNYLYWMSANCGYVKDKWEGVVDELKKNLAISKDVKDASLSCSCGGGCKE